MNISKPYDEKATYSGDPKRREFWRRQGEPAEREMSRAKRERVARYYSKVLSMALAALDDGRPTKFPGRDYIEWVLSALGYDCEDWTRLGDDELVRLNTCHLRQTDDAGHEAEVKRLQKQRERTAAWQGEAGNPIVVDHRVVYDQEAQRNYSEYRVPIGGLIREIIEDAPIGTRDYHLKQKIKKHVRTYLLRFDGVAKPVRKTRHPSAISDAHRGATFVRKALDNESRKSGKASAINLLRSSLRAELGDDFREIFGPTNNSDNPQDSQQDTGISLCDNCRAAFSRQATEKSTTYAEKESDQKFDEKDGKRTVRI